MPEHRTRPEASPFAALERAFALLCAGPRPLALDGAGITGLPERPVPLDELRDRLLHPSTSYATRDAALQALVGRARAEGGAWAVGLAGVLLPGLRRAVAPLVAACPGKAADLEAETLAGLLVALGRCSPGRPRPAGFLCGRAFDAAKRLLRAELAERSRPGHGAASAEPPKPFGHPDFVLARAVAHGAICADDAELIGATRLGGTSLADTARAWGLSYKAAERRRNRAERAVVAWVLDGFVAGAAVPAGYRGVGRPRQGRRPDQPSGFRQPTEPPANTRR
jgi:DNA-directed RNA polymerase specialized sigma24 family protein